MKRINLFLLLLLSTLSFAQSWQSKDVVRIENTESSFHYTFYDSTTLYIQKQNVSYIVSLPNSNYIQVGYLYEGATSKIMSCTYNTLTQPVLSSNSELVDTLNAWLNEPSSGGGGGSQTLSISNDTLSISNGNSVVLPIYFQSDLATLIDACPNVDVETLDGSETFPILKDDTVYQLSLGAFAELVGGGGIPDAPNDGQLYGRQSENWSVVPDAELPSTDSLEFFTDTSTTSPGFFLEYLGSKVKGRDIGTSGFTTYHQTIYGNGFSYSKMGNASSFILIDDNNDVQIEAQFGKLKIYPPNWDSQPYGSVLTLIGANGECEWQSVLRGTATLSSGTVTVSTASIHTGYKIYVSVDTPSGTLGFLSAPTGSIVDGTEFVINSTSATDDSIVNWWIAP